MSRAIPVALFAVALALLPLSALSGQAIISLQALEAPSLDQTELAAIQNLVLGAILELKSFRVLDPAGHESAEAEAGLGPGGAAKADPLSPDYLIGGSILPEGELFLFSLEATRLSTGERRGVSETLKDRAELILAARRLTRRLLDREESVGHEPAPAPQNASAAAPEGPSLALPEAARRPSLARLAGSWSGDKGLDRVTLYPDGRGIAFLSSGASMRIRASLSGDRIVISQDQANRPEFYRSGAIDLATARSISAQARPWTWIFSLSVDGNTLFGIKESVFVSRDEEGRLSVDNAYVRNALWLRTER